MGPAAADEGTGTGAGPLRVERLEGGAIARVVLARPKANVLDRAMIGALERALDDAARDPHTRAVIIAADGPSFSYGASVQEHLPGEVGSMLAGFHAMFRTMLETGLVCLAAVRGSCLGGGLELASFCHRVFCAPDARLGQPEIALGVFAPLASVLLADRVGRGPAEDLLLSGRTIAAEEALRIGLVDEVSDDPDAAALAYARTHLLPRSASSLRFAARAARLGLERRLADLERAEALYLDGLMATADAEEGLRAFLEKRRPAWSDR